MATPAPRPTFFRAPALFRAWLSKNHDKKTELWVGFYKKASGKGGMTYKEAVDESLCFGWIDGILKSIDGDSFKQRYTPRKKDSHWSLVNVRRFAELDVEGRIAPPGRAAFERKTAARTGKASYESAPSEFTAAQTKQLKANTKAWQFLESMSPSYNRAVRHWVTTAKQEATKERRLALLIECSVKGERIPQFISPQGKK